MIGGGFWASSPPSLYYDIDDRAGIRPTHTQPLAPTAMASTSKSLARTNKSLNEVRATKGCAALGCGRENPPLVWLGEARIVTGRFAIVRACSKKRKYEMEVVAS